MNALVGIDGIRVASRTSTFRAHRDGGSLQAIAQTLSVTHVLEGGVRIAGGRLRVTARLTEAAHGFQLWSDRHGKTPHPFACVQVPGPLFATGAAAIADFWIYAG